MHVPRTVPDVNRQKRYQSSRQARRWVAVAHGDVGTPGMAEHPLHTIRVHLAGAQTRRARLEGRDYLVAPVIPLVEGVLNEYLIPADEIGAYVQSWNGIPLPVNHPSNAYGDPISANSPDVIEQACVGRFFGAHMDGHRLMGELWLDVQKCTDLGGEALECLRRLEAGLPLEVSTAFYADTVMQQGIYNGARYIGVHRHLRPDHLALLPHTIGACDWRMGCGAPRVQCACQGQASLPPPHSNLTPEKASPMPTDKKGLFQALGALFRFASGEDGGEPDASTLTTNLTHADLRTALYAALARGRNMMYGPDLIEDIEDGFVIYKDGERCFRRAYSVGDNNEITLTGEAEEVQRDTRYVPVAPLTTQQDKTMPPAPPRTGAPLETPKTPQGEGQSMKKDDSIKALVAHERTAWTEQDAVLLATLTEEQLDRLVREAESRKPEASPTTHAVVADATGTGAGGPQPITTAPPPITLDAIHGLLKQELDERDKTLEDKLAMFAQKRSEQEERGHLVSHLTQQGWTEAECVSMSIEALRKVAQTVSPTTFAGMGFPRFPQGNAEDAQLPDDEPKWS